MTISTLTLTLNRDINTVWNKITSLTDYAWRTDLESIEITGKNQFKECDKNGFITLFTVTEFKIPSLYAFDMENKNMQGSWVGSLKQCDGYTLLCMTENMRVKKWYLKPFIKLYLHKHQRQYAKDLINSLL